MKILIVSDFFPIFHAPGGAATRVYCLMRELARKHTLTLLTTRWPGIETEPETIKDICRDARFYEFAERGEIASSPPSAAPRNDVQGGMQVSRTDALMHSRTNALGPRNTHNALRTTKTRIKELRHLLFEPTHMVHSTYRHNKNFYKALADINLAEYDLIQVEDSYIAYRLLETRKKYPRIPIVVDLHNVNTLMEKRDYELAQGWRWRFYNYTEWKKMYAYEKKMFNFFDLNLTCSDEDKRIGLEMAPRAHFATIPNGVDTSFFSNTNGKPEPNSLFFLGSNWPPNVDGILYFHKEIFPEILRKIPDVKLYIIGNFSKNEQVTALADRHTILTGFVNDVREWMSKAAVSIVPLRMGGGTRLKILEALSFGKAIVSTSMGAEGIEVTHGRDIMLADTPAEFADAVVTLLLDENACRIFGENGRRLAVERYDWNVIGKKLNGTYEELMRCRL